MNTGSKEPAQRDYACNGPGSHPLLQLVEDDPEIRQYMKDELTGAYRVIESADGLSGYQQALTERPDIILSDVTMPGMDGLTLCRKLKTDDRTRHIPVMLLTGLGAESQTLEGLACGADDYVQKPFSLLILKAKIRNLIRSREVLRQWVASQPDALLTADVSPVSNETFLRKAQAIVEQNLSNADFEATDFARAIGMSRAQLYRRLHTVSGQTVKEFVRVIRLKKAVDMIGRAEHNISQAAFEVGFSSVAYFTKAFTAHFGLCPTKYMAGRTAGK